MLRPFVRHQAGDHARVCRRDPVAGQRQAQELHEAAGGPLDHLAVNERADGHDGSGAGAERGTNIAGSRIGPIDTTGLEGPITIARASAIASRTSGVADAARAPRKSTPSTGP